MTRLSPAASVASCALGLLLSLLLPGGCAADDEPLDSGSATGAGGAGGSSGDGQMAGSSGRFPFGGRSSSSAAGQASAGDESTEGGESSGAGQRASGGAPNATDRCSADSDCVQVEGSCFVCETAGVAKDCVDKGPPACDNGKLEACELCELDQVKSCLELGKHGQFSGGTASCAATCDAWDTSTCSVCGNGRREPGEDCDGLDPPQPQTCADVGLGDDPTAILACTEQCRFDTTVCGGCSEDASQCLDGSACSATACNGAQCKIDTTCEIDCNGSDKSCSDVQCNHGATCDFECSTRGRCVDVVCDSKASCVLDCAAGNCDGSLCKVGATCDFNCHSGSCQNIVCQPGAACDFECDGSSSRCSGSASCGPGQTCTFDCSGGGDCSDLAVTCLNGSSCAFTCNDGDSVCPRADCQTGSSCTFACESGDCNSPDCAGGACSGI